MVENNSYNEWKARNERAIAAVSCPRCKAPAGRPCEWGSTNSSQPHTPRFKKAVKEGAI